MRSLYFIVIVLFLLIFPIKVSAAMISIDNIEKGKSMFRNESSFSESIDSASHIVNDSAMIWSSIIPGVFTVIFIYFLIRFAYALITKVGSTLKSATWGIISVPLIFIFFRITGIFMLSENNITSVDRYLNDLISLLSSSIFYVSIGLVLISIIFKYANILIEHPAYGRWSKRLLLFSFISILLSVIIKPLLYNI